MNAHDSERIKGLLEELGLGEAPNQDEADVLVFNTCTIREKPDTRLAAHLGNARMLKEQDPGRVIAVGGCYAEAQRDRIFETYPFVDVAFGPGSIPHLAEWLGAGGEGVARGAFGTAEERAFAGRLPMHRERRFQAWVQISMGCNSVCAYCIVPAVRGREVSRRPGEILAEVERLAAQGVREITLLGQNVNSYGRDVGSDFSELLRACDAVEGRGGRGARPDSRGRQARADRAARRGRSADRRAAEPRARGPHRGGARRGAEPHGRGASARPHPAQYHRRLHRGRAAGRAGAGPDRGRDVGHIARRRASCSCRLETSSGTAASTSAISAAIEPWTAARRASARG